MAKNILIEDVAEEILQSVLASPQHQRRMKSKTLWNGKFDIYSRKDQLVEQVYQVLKSKGVEIHVADDQAFGTEDMEKTWLTLFCTATLELDGIPTPPDTWFDRLAHLSHPNDYSVDSKFIGDLFEQLGFQEVDFASKEPLDMYDGSAHRTLTPDFVLYTSEVHKSPEAALVVIESDRDLKPKKALAKALGQAKSYAYWTTAPYYVATDGRELYVYLHCYGILKDIEVITVRVEELKEHWRTLYTILSKDAVTEFKEKITRDVRKVVATLHPGLDLGETKG